MISDDFLETLEAELRRAHPQVLRRRRRRRVLAAGRVLAVAAALIAAVLLVRGGPGDEHRERPAKPLHEVGFAVLDRAPTVADLALQARIRSADPDQNLAAALADTQGLEITSLRAAATVDNTTIATGTTRSGKRCLFVLGPGADGQACRQVPALGTGLHTLLQLGGRLRLAGVVDDSVKSVTVAGADGTRRTYPVTDNVFAVPVTDGLVTWVQWEQPDGTVRVNVDSGISMPGRIVLRISDTFTLKVPSHPGLRAGEHLSVWLRTPGRPDRHLRELAPISQTGERSFERPGDVGPADSVLVTADTSANAIGRVIGTVRMRVILG